MVPKGAKPKPAKLAKEKKEVRAMSWDPMAYDDNFAIIKFVKDANNKDGWVFKKIYKFPEENIEVVYDDKLEELGEYVEHPNWEKDNFGEDCIICTKYDKDEKIINSYTSYKGFRRGKTFPFFVQQLKDNTILDGDYSTDYRWYHFWKTDNTEIKYLVLNPPFEILHEEEGNDGKIIHEVKD